MISAFTGLIAGLAHVWSGPDHLAAIAPLALRHKRRSWAPGIRWGLGHSAGVALVGLFTLGFREIIPLDWLSSFGERLVGILLVGIGLWALRQALRHNVHTHEHEHDGSRHVHIHFHEHTAHHDEPAAHRAHSHAAFGIGTLHGLAGSSHLFGVLPMLAFPDKSQAAAYLAAFAAGTVASMALFSWLMGAVAARCGAGKFYRGILAASAATTIIVGAFWLASAVH